MARDANSTVLPSVFHRLLPQGVSQLVERVDDGTEERWVLLPGCEEKCTTLYQEVLAEGLKLDDETDAGKLIKKAF